MHLLALNLITPLNETLEKLMFIQTFTKVQVLKEPKEDFETPSSLLKGFKKNK
jgi:hypothetical protein